VKSFTSMTFPEGIHNVNFDSFKCSHLPLVDQTQWPIRMCSSTSDILKTILCVANNLLKGIN
jgi:hypothetical protein